MGRAARRSTITAPAWSTVLIVPPPDAQAAPAVPGLAAFRAYAALVFSFAWVPVMYTAFVHERGFSPGDYARMWSAYYTAMVLAELPWGWVADRLGSKPLLILGPLLLAAAFFVLGRAQDLSTCLAAMALTGAAHAMISGADSAWLYEQLRAGDRGATALGEEAHAHRWRLLGVSAADFLGGRLAFAFGTVAAFDLSVGLMLAAAGVAACLPATGPRSREGARVAGASGPSPVRRLKTDLARPGVLWSLVWFAVVFALLRVGFQLYQPTLLDHGVDDLRRHGDVFAGLNLVAGLAVLAVAPVHRRLGEVSSALGVLLLLVLAFGGLALGGRALLLPMLALQQVSFAFLQPIGRTALNRRLPSRDRAGWLSAQSVAGRLTFAVILLVVDGVAAVGDLESTYLMLALGGLVLLACLALTAPRGRPGAGSARSGD